MTYAFKKQKWSALFLICRLGLRCGPNEARKSVKVDIGWSNCSPRLQGSQENECARRIDTSELGQIKPVCRACPLQFFGKPQQRAAKQQYGPIAAWLHDPAIWLIEESKSRIHPHETAVKVGRRCQRQQKPLRVVAGSGIGCLA